MKSKLTLVLTLIIFAFLFLSLSETAYAGASIGTLWCCMGDSGCIGCGEQEICAISSDECPDQTGTEFYAGELCITTNEDECKTPDGGELGCCVVADDVCIEATTVAGCNQVQGISWFAGVPCFDVPQCQEDQVDTAVPTLSEWGLIAMASVLGIVGFMVIRRRQVSA